MSPPLNWPSLFMSPFKMSQFGNRAAYAAGSASARKNGSMSPPLKAPSQFRSPSSGGGGGHWFSSTVTLWL